MIRTVQCRKCAVGMNIAAVVVQGIVISITICVHILQKTVDKNRERTMVAYHCPLDLENINQDRNLIMQALKKKPRHINRNGRKRAGLIILEMFITGLTNSEIFPSSSDPGWMSMVCIDDVQSSSSVQLMPQQMSCK